MKILLVDDSRAMRNIVQWNLQHSEICIDKIFEASCVQDAFQIIEDKKPDVVITDWNMPELAGLQLLKAVRETQNPVRFGFMITQSSTSILNLIKDAGADFIISSPSSTNTVETQICQSL